MSKKIPKGWLDFEPYGEKVDGTVFFPFKTPLKQEILENKIPKDKWFTPATLMDKCKKVRAIIDLTNTAAATNRYYNPQDFFAADVDYLKITVAGGGLVPGKSQIAKFSDAVDEFVRKFADDPDALVGVHCTHGLNRTGYFICKYMVTRLNCQPTDAIHRFQKARGHVMYRQNYIQDILNPGVFAGQRQRPQYHHHHHQYKSIANPTIENWRQRPLPSEDNKRRPSNSWRRNNRRRDQSKRNNGKRNPPSGPDVQVNTNK